MRNLTGMILLLLLISSGISQTVSKQLGHSPDSITCLPTSQLRVAIKKIEGAKILQQQFDACRLTGALMERIILVADSTIQEAKKADSVWRERIDIVYAERDNVADQRNAALTYSWKAEDAYKKQKRVTLVVAGVGIVVCTSLFIILLHQ